MRVGVSDLDYPFDEVEVEHLPRVGDTICFESVPKNGDQIQLVWRRVRAVCHFVRRLTDTKNYNFEPFDQFLGVTIYTQAVDAPLPR